MPFSLEMWQIWRLFFPYTSFVDIIALFFLSPHRKILSQKIKNVALATVCAKVDTRPTWCLLPCIQWNPTTESSSRFKRVARIDMTVGTRFPKKIFWGRIWPLFTKKKWIFFPHLAPVKGLLSTTLVLPTKTFTLMLKFLHRIRSEIHLTHL